MKARLFSSFFFFLIVSCTNNSGTINNVVLGDKTLDSLYTITKNVDLSRRERLKYIDTLLIISNKQKNNYYTIKGLMLKTTLSAKSDLDSAIFYSKQLKSLAAKNGDFLNFGKALMKLGVYHRRIDSMETSFKYFNEAYVNFKFINDSANIASSLLEMAKIQKSYGDFTGSENTAIDGLKFLNNTKNNLKTKVALLHTVSTCLREEGDFEAALKFNKDALHIFFSSKYTRILKNTQANILADLKKYDKAIEILSELLIKIDPIKERKEYARIIDNLGFFYWKKNTKNPKSQQLLEEAKAIRLRSDDTRGLIASHMHYAEYYYFKDSLIALNHAEEALKKSQQIKSQTAQLEALDYIIKLKDNPKQEALLYTNIDKNLRKINQNNRELYAETKYENEKLLKENSITKADGLKKEKQKTLYLFGLITAIFASTSIVIMLRNRYAKEKRKKVYETEKHISKRIHDELANDVYSVMMQLENNSLPVSKAVENLEDIYNKARDLSQEKFSFNTNEEFIEDLKKTLSMFSNGDTNVIVQGLIDYMWRDVSEKKKIVVLLAVKELLVNMKKHSKATLVSIVFKRINAIITINYKDNGIGIYKTAATSGIGLTNTENRISSINGIFTFDTSTTGGLKIEIKIPV